MHALEAIITEAHAYLGEQRQSGNDAQYNVILASQARSIKTKIEQQVDGVCTGDATAMIELVRQGPWAATHINSIASAFNKAVERGARHHTLREERKPQTCDNVEVFWSNPMWERTLDTSKTRSRRMADVASILVSMDLTNPNPKMQAAHHRDDVARGRVDAAISIQRKNCPR